MRRLAALLLALHAGACMRNLRPDALDAANVAAQEKAGRALLARAREAHGGDAAFVAHDTMTVTLRDTWRGSARLVNPWPASEVHLRLDLARGRLLARATFLDGDPKDTQWGVDGDHGWTQAPGEALDRDPSDGVRFVLAAVQYLLELPFRIGEATVVADAGAATIAGKAYDRVFATWSAEPTTDCDQFVVYLDHETGRVAKVHFTVRKLNRAVQSTVHYEDLRDEGGLVLPHAWSQTAEPEDDPADWIRRLAVETYRFDATPSASLHAPGR